MADFPDIEDVLTVLLEDLADTGTETPPTFTEDFIRVRRLGGRDDGITDFANVDIECFSLRRSTAVALAESVRQRVIGGPHHVNGAVIDGATTNSGPSPLPWDDPKVRRRGANYTVPCRRKLA